MTLSDRRGFSAKFYGFNFVRNFKIKTFICTLYNLATSLVRYDVITNWYDVLYNILVKLPALVGKMILKCHKLGIQ